MKSEIPKNVFAATRRRAFIFSAARKKCDILAMRKKCTCNCIADIDRPPEHDVIFPAIFHIDKHDTPFPTRSLYVAVSTALRLFSALANATCSVHKSPDKRAIHSAVFSLLSVRIISTAFFSLFDKHIHTAGWYMINNKSHGGPTLCSQFAFPQAVVVRA